MALLHFLLACALSILTAADPQVTIGSTTIVGNAISTMNQESFLGIPYASPPLGDLRLKPPVLATTLNVSTFAASGTGPACLQLNQGYSSEDCLTINIVRPAGIDANAKLPVLTWIYGGGFYEGAAFESNGSFIVAQSVERETPLIYVNFNYRLGPLGFPVGPEAASLGALNLGLKDQIAALQWIQANIGAFGGDPAKVTVFGQSAGAISIALHFLDPSFGDLARAAIFESGSAGTMPANPGAIYTGWPQFVAAVPACASLATSNSTFDCLQNASAADIQTGLNAVDPTVVHFVPAIDGAGGVLPDYPSNLIEKGGYAKLPFIAGTNMDEGTLFTPTTVNSTADIAAWMNATFIPSLPNTTALQSATAEILQLYPDDPSVGSPFGTGVATFGLAPEYKEYAAILGDVQFQAPRRGWIQTASDVGVTTFGYLFMDPQNWGPQYGVAHSTEVNYVYGYNQTTDSAQALSKIMVDYWVSFATSLNPNDGKGTARPNWPQYTSSNQVLLQLNGTNTTTIPDTYRAEQIGYIVDNSLVFHQ